MSNLRTLITCQKGCEAFLLNELKLTFPMVMFRKGDAACMVSGSNTGFPQQPLLTVGFARQIIPHARPFHEKTINDVVSTTAQHISDKLKSHTGPWRVHMLTPISVIYPGKGRGVVQSAILNLLKKKNPSLYSSFNKAAEYEVFRQDEALVQLLFNNPTTGFVSVVSGEEVPTLRRVLSPFSAGVVSIPKDPTSMFEGGGSSLLEKTPPSGAYAKLMEAEIRLGRTILPGERCVDLGSCPGGWTYVALQRGASVISIDWTKLREDLMQHPSLKFLEGDAFQFEPSKPVDWLLCDVLTYPHKTLELLQQWLVKKRLCKYFVVTVKFLGNENYGILEEIKETMNKSGAEYQIRRLDNNGNEVTVYGKFT